MKSNVALLPRSLDRLAAAALLTVVLALSALAPAMAMAAERAQPTAIVATANTLDVLAEAALSSQTDDGDIAVCAICKSPVCTGHSAVLTASSPDSVVPVAWTLVPSLPFAAPKPLPAGPPSRTSALPLAFNPRAPPSVG
ncbi:MAG: hypothetical protein J0H44_08640 [Alphaproteobacteria bacterium]|nr:hypothetical protein [Alphaproteobacteria bacterium]